jgi:hypothetical protein
MGLAAENDGAKMNNTHAKIYYKKGYKNQLTRDFVVQTEIRLLDDVCIDGFIYLTKNGLLTIYNKYAWDGSSGPTLDSKKDKRASCAHDALTQLMREGKLSRTFRPMIDDLYCSLCRDDKMWKYQAKWRRWGLKKFGRPSTLYKNRRKELVAP